MVEPGSKVRIKTKKKVFEGILMPNTHTKNTVIKLKSGYNIGIESSTITNIKIIEKPKKTKKEKTKPKKASKAQKKIAVLHTGGTIASKIDYTTGGVIAKFSADDLLEMVPELGEIANIKTELVANMMSEDMRFNEIVLIAKAVKKQVKKGVDGIIVGHGTDTLTYTSAGLAFMLENINIPVILVGSQRSTDRASSDGAMNLICAGEFISQTDFRGIALCMHKSTNDDVCSILPALKTRKMHTSRRDAFKPINASAIAEVNYSNRKIKYLKNLARSNKTNAKPGKFKALYKFNENVGLIKTHTNMDPEFFKLITKHFKAIVFEGTGLGHIPTNKGKNLENYEILKNYIKKGGVVAITSQCIYGSVHANVYTNLRRLKDIGCIFCHDMLAETAYIKLSWLIGNFPKNQIKELMQENLRGEINNKLSLDDYDIYD